jgi:hypothetical protein
MSFFLTLQMEVASTAGRRATLRLDTTPLMSCCWLRVLSLRFGQHVVILESRPGLELGLVSSPVFVLLLAQTAVSLCFRQHVVILGQPHNGQLLDHDRDLRWVSRQVQFLSGRWLRLLSLRIGPHVVILRSRPGHELGLASRPSHVLLLAQRAVAALRSGFWASWITTRPGSRVESSSCIVAGSDCRRRASVTVL